APLTAEEYAAYKAGQAAADVSSSIQDAAQSHVGASTLMSAAPLTAEEYAAYKAGQAAANVSSSIQDAAQSHVGASTLMSAAPLDMNEYLVETLNAAVAAKASEPAAAGSSPVELRRTEDYYNLARKLLSADNYRKFMEIERFYHDAGRYEQNMATAQKIIEILKTAPLVKEVHGVGYPFYGDVDIRMRIHKTLERLEAGEISEDGFMKRITPDFDMVIVAEDHDLGPFQVSSKMDDKLSGYLVRYVTSFRRQWAQINRQLQAEAPMADLYADRDGALDTLLNEGKYTLDLVYIPEHVWNEMPVFVEKDDADTFKVIRDLLFSLDTGEETPSLVTSEFLQNTILNTLKGGAMLKEGLLQSLLTEQPHAGMIELYDASERMVRAKMEKALACAVAQGLVTVKGKDVLLSAQGEARLADVLARRQKLLDSGYDLDGRTYLSELQRSSAESSSSPMRARNHKNNNNKKNNHLREQLKILSLDELPVYQRGDSIQNYMEMIIQLAGTPAGMKNIFEELFTAINKMDEKSLKEKDSAHLEYLKTMMEDIYAPLAERLGQDQWSTMLRNEIFRVAHPEEYKEIKDYIETELLGMTYKEAERLLEDVRKKVHDRLEGIFGDSGIKFEISSRVKSVYSIAEKIRRQERKGKDDPLYDLLGLHVVIEGEIRDYWDALRQIEDGEALFNDIGTIIPERTKYRMISSFDRYDAYHMGIMVPDIQRGREVPLEIKFMDENNLHLMRFGTMAAHWVYKMAEMYPKQKFNFRQVDVVGDFDADFKRLQESLSDAIYVQVYEPAANKRHPKDTFRTIKMKEGSIPGDLAAMKEMNKLRDDYLGVETLRVVHDMPQYAIKSRQMRNAGYKLKSGDVVAFNPAARVRTFKSGLKGKTYLQRNRKYILENALYLRTVLLLEKYDFQAVEKGRQLLQSLGLDNTLLIRKVYHRWGFLDKNTEFEQLISNENVVLRPWSIVEKQLKIEVVEVNYAKGQAREACVKAKMKLAYDRIGLLKEISDAVSAQKGYLLDQVLQGDNLVLEVYIPAENVVALKDMFINIIEKKDPRKLPTFRRVITLVTDPEVVGGLQELILERIAGMRIQIDDIKKKEIEDGFTEWTLKVRTEKGPSDASNAIITALQDAIPGSMVQVSSPIQQRMTFAEFMARAQGEYYGQIAQIGRDKDFDTFVEDRKTARYFGFATGHQLAEMWDLLGRPAKFNVVEMGAGNGTYAMNIMTYLKEYNPALYEALDYVIVEFSENLRGNQQAKLQEFSGKVRWIEKSVLDLNEQDLADVEGVFLSNELIDALPGHRLKVVGGEWKEVYTVEEDGAYTDETGELSSQELKEYAANLGVTLAEGTEIFVQPAIAAWLQAVARALKRGFVISIDYGGKIDENVEGRTYSVWSGKEEHIDVADIYAQAGKVDITAMVNFHDVAQAGEHTGLTTEGFTYQRDWLWNLNEELVRLSDWAESDIATNFGFKVLIQSKGLKAGLRLKGLKEAKPEERFGYLFTKNVALQLPETLKGAKYLVVSDQYATIPAQVIQAGRNSVEQYIREQYSYRYTDKPELVHPYNGQITISRAKLEGAVLYNDQGEVIFNGQAFFAENPQLIKAWGLTKAAFADRYASRVDLSRPDTDAIPEIFTLTKDLGLRAVESKASSPVGGAEQVSSPVDISIIEVPFSGSRVSEKTEVPLRFVPVEDEEESKETVVVSMKDIMRPSSFLESLLRLWKQFVALINRFFGRYAALENVLTTKAETLRRNAVKAKDGERPATLRMIDPALVSVAAQTNTPVGASTLMSSTP
ncbi:MAG TPA: SAM-dependent methyltransferase, partial [Candidatus Omnitrophota bacterium]|nr:SAM-dependent methyltransferase [Candidatus Omnitrophota bacterium]